LSTKVVYLMHNRVSILGKSTYLLGGTANLSTFSYGSFVGWASPAILELQSDHSAIGGDAITDEDASWIGSLMFIGFLCGTPVYSWLSDRFGRKPAALLTSIPIIVNWLIIIFSETVFLIFIARFIVGISIGGILTIIPIYVGEICEIHVRGTLGTILSVLGNGGILFSYAVGAYSQYHNFAITCLALPILFVVSFMWMPETPIYLLSKGKYKEAKRSLKHLRGSRGPHIYEELNKMSTLLRDIQERTSDSGAIKDLLQNKGSRKALIIGVVISATQMFSGIYAMLSYNGIIFKMSGADLPPHICSIIVGGVLFVAPILSLPLMDRVGRKILLVASLTIMTTCLTLLGVYFYLLEIGTDLSTVGYIPVVCMGIYLLCMGMGLAPINIVLFSEIFLPHVRSISASISTFVMAISSFIVTRFYNDLSNVAGVYGSFWFFAICCLLGTCFSIVCIPETKNRTVESIHAELNGGESSLLPTRNERNLNTISEQCEQEGNLSTIK
ncbi:hypothetical protein L9F63_011746, partial [Diploptera punctata]